MILTQSFIEDKGPSLRLLFNRHGHHSDMHSLALLNKPYYCRYSQNHARGNTVTDRSMEYVYIYIYMHTCCVIGILFVWIYSFSREWHWSTSHWRNHIWFVHDVKELECALLCVAQLVRNMQYIYIYICEMTITLIDNRHLHQPWDCTIKSTPSKYFLRPVWFDRRGHPQALTHKWAHVRHDDWNNKNRQLSHSPLVAYVSRYASPLSFPRQWDARTELVQ